MQKKDKKRKKKTNVIIVPIFIVLNDKTEPAMTIKQEAAKAAVLPKETAASLHKETAECSSRQQAETETQSKTQGCVIKQKVAKATNIPKETTGCSPKQQAGTGTRSKIQGRVIQMLNQKINNKKDKKKKDYLLTEAFIEQDSPSGKPEKSSPSKFWVKNATKLFEQGIIDNDTISFKCRIKAFQGNELEAEDISDIKILKKHGKS